jgi:hypothetical protein
MFRRGESNDIGGQKWGFRRPDGAPYHVPSPISDGDCETKYFQTVTQISPSIPSKFSMAARRMVLTGFRAKWPDLNLAVAGFGK